MGHRKTLYADTHGRFLAKAMVQLTGNIPAYAEVCDGKELSTFQNESFMKPMTVPYRREKNIALNRTRFEKYITK